MTNDGEYDKYTTVRYYNRYYPPGVKRIIDAGGTSSWIGEVDDSTVFKYPLAAGENLEGLEAERKILEAIPPHKNVLGFKGFTDAGIYLERAPNGTIAEYILDSGKPLSLQQRLAWCRETAEAVDWIHAHRVLHCDIQPTNLLLDKDLHVKLSDFQGKLLAEDGTVLADGGSMEPCRYSLPRDDFRADVKTDLFALGCTIYFILLGHQIFPDIDLKDEDAWEKVEERLTKKEWPQEQQVCSAVTVKCWEQQYESVEEVVRDLEAIEREHGGLSAVSVPGQGLGELAGARDNKPLILGNGRGGSRSGSPLG